MEPRLIFFYASECFKAATPLSIGGFAVWIAWQQWQTANRKVKLDLFDRRYQIYLAAEQLLRDMAINLDVNSDQHEALERAISQGQFLFPQEVVTFLNELSAKARELRSMKRRINTATESADPEKLGSVYESQSRLDEWMIKELTGLAARFRGHLDFNDVK